MDQKDKSRNARAPLKSGESPKETRKTASREPPQRSSSAARSSVTTQKQSTRSSRTLTKEERRRLAAAAVPAPAQVTIDALASINYAAFKQRSLTARQRRARMMKDFLAAHNMGAQHIDEEWKEAHDALWNNYMHSSYAPQSREIQRLMDKVQQTELHYQQRLQHANAITSCVMSGIEGLLTRMTESGMSISAQTQVLSGDPDPVLATSADGVAKAATNEPNEKEQGIPHEEVRDYDPSQPLPHPPAFRFGEADQEEVTRVKKIFERAVASIAARKQHGNGADASLSFSSNKPAREDDGTLQNTMVFPESEAAHEADTPHTECAKTTEDVLSSSTVADAERLRQVNELHHELDRVGEAFVTLVKRVEVRHQQYQAKIAAQREALDDAATRTKLADDLLRGTIAQGEVEAGSAVVEVQKLSLKLHRRMVASEVAMQAALDTLIKESAEVCVANGALHDHAALTLNRENCLYAYMSRMEREVVEQADVLRQAQDTVTHLWRRVHTPAQLQQHQQTQSAAPNETGKADSSSFAVPNTSIENRNLFPPQYQEVLRQSDRSSLLELAERISQHSTEVAALAVRVLDEQQARATLHPVEAAAAREAHLRTVSTQQLLEKLDAEGYLRSNERQTTLPLSERVTRLVTQYDAYVDFNEQYARALVRQADVVRREQSPSQFAFFDSRTPVPGLKSAATSTPAAPVKSVSRKAAAPTTDAAASATKTCAPDTYTDSSVSLPYLQLWEGKQREAQQRQRELVTAAGDLSTTNPANSVDIGQIVNYLDRTTPHIRPKQELVPSPPRAITAGPATMPPPSALRPRRHTAIGATTLTCESTTPPPPPVPPRSGLASYILATYAENAENADHREEAAVQFLSGKRPKSRVLPYRDGERQFIERQREVFKQLI
ncbi:hypothetical protein ABB37_03321 [Leptomonas pyrrhocoris]|uniref:Uncharacterized protein n=1 Tax=Leptomonas pyrrhocoris TaxID=157538 RepID=A0A0M9G4X3_LEPPY|nr:hypothetical protein ABB37_03321 [Leptomonas pyrrhocoris]KPA82199.1 hypothetical protein ABB37_03321 [Leptomonas pyrrhocoris]|eukprot:XP_015660638.1 hypothetical protein ABB37_03321 [Leptomonas pyrrhocoris]